MTFPKRLTLSSMTFAAIFAGSSALHAQETTKDQNELCRLGLYNPFVGAYTDTLIVTGLGTSQSLIVFNQGGTLTETDAIDLNDPNTVHSPGYGSWKALDCAHYKVTINKINYNSATKQFETTVLEGDALLGEDGNSWVANLNQKFFNASGDVISTDSVTATAVRIKPGSTK